MCKKKSKWRVIWDGDSFIDGRECKSFDEARDDVFDTLFNWGAEQLDSMGVTSYDGWTEEQIEEWDMMVYNCASWVERYEDGEWVEHWYPSEEDLAEIGWLPYEELLKQL